MKRYTNINIETGTKGPYRGTVIYPEIPLSENDFYIIVQAGDRYDILAKTFYNDATLWWIIAASNNNTTDNLIPIPGTQLRIPGNVENVLSLFNKINNTR